MDNLVCAVIKVSKRSCLFGLADSYSKSHFENNLKKKKRSELNAQAKEKQQKNQESQTITN